MNCSFEKLYFFLFVFFHFADDGDEKARKMKWNIIKNG